MHCRFPHTLGICLLAFSCGKPAAVQLPTDNPTAAMAAGTPTDPARAILRGYIEQVKLSDARRYDAKDNAGHNMDCAKIIANPAGGYIAVYHTYVNGEAKVNLATSTDILNWTWVRELAGSNTGSASQPDIAVAADGGFVMVWEQEPSNHLKFTYFSSWNNLKNGVVSKSFDAPRTLSSCAEGTPNIYYASSTRVETGHHYYANCDTDRQARGILTNFRTWTTQRQPDFDNALLYWGVKGNIGDRDVTTFNGYQFGVIEGQYLKGDFGSWRTFLYDYQTGNADTLHIITDHGSKAFANPTITRLQIGGQPAILVTLFIPGKGAAPGEAGELIYYKKY
ncbi:hypothetical protein [Chitinophaga nivalis]|uniref:Uncharacterized protein n=1 Tax=Chitinophaga nivalis TaxID=2991709 RepID=A0ABT3IK69_9BACT|nr:hypothetical protein [Chitinophaga nivalis]MCW3465998.1 hypothetical protein [Chitinophaga nivalis]MCW3484311.1 hypothetical protein [Chitinophaga nivalis]